MTRIDVFMAPEGAAVQGFYVHGHAGYAEAGEDIVCAAISALALSCVNGLERIANITPRVKLEPEGTLYMLLPDGLTDEQRQTAQILLLGMVGGFQDIEEAYPGHVDVIITEWRQSECLL